MKIDSIKIKNNKIICSINSKEYTISSDTYAKYYLYPNKEITEDELSNIINDSNLIKAKNYLSQLLSKGSYTTATLKQKLTQKFKLSDDDISALLEPYIESNVIDDYSFALDYIQSKNYLCYGENYLKEKLIQKGINKKIFENNQINDALKFNNQFLDKFALSLVDKNSSLPISKQKQDLFDFLTRRGFNYQDINNSIDKLSFTNGPAFNTTLNKRIKQLVLKLNNKNIPNNQKREALIQKLIYYGYRYEDFSNLINNIFD